MIVNPITLSPTHRIYEALELMKKYRISGRADHRGRQQGRPAGRHPDQPRPAVRDERRPADRRRHDARAPHHRAGRHDARRGARDPAPAQGREAAGRRSRLPAEGPDHRQGHPEGGQVSRTRRRTRSAGCGAARRSASRATRWSAPRRSSRRNVDVLVVDTAHGHSQGVLDMVRAAPPALSGRRSRSPATWRRPKRTEALIALGVDAVKVGHRRRLDLHDARHRRHRRADDHRRHGVRARGRARTTSR